MARYKSAATRLNSTIHARHSDSINAYVLRVLYSLPHYEGVVAWLEAQPDTYLFCQTIIRAVDAYERRRGLHAGTNIHTKPSTASRRSYGHAKSTVDNQQNTGSTRSSRRSPAKSSTRFHYINTAEATCLATWDTADPTFLSSAISIGTHELWHDRFMHPSDVRLCGLESKHAPLWIANFFTDQGCEYLDRAFQQFLRKEGIIHLTTLPYAPSSNDIRERMHRANLSPTFWSYALRALPQLYPMIRCRSNFGIKPGHQLNAYVPLAVNFAIDSASIIFFERQFLYTTPCTKTIYTDPFQITWVNIPSADVTADEETHHPPSSPLDYGRDGSYTDSSVLSPTLAAILQPQADPSDPSESVGEHAADSSDNDSDDDVPIRHQIAKQ
eukprot:Ihof_evm1s905 gene=Ihof_evmTU1s905